MVIHGVTKSDMTENLEHIVKRHILLCDIKKRWQEYMEELYKKKKKSLTDPNNHDSVITHLEPDILEYEIKWALLLLLSHFSRVRLCATLYMAAHQASP